jgi:hypothetical protein
MRHIIPVRSLVVVLAGLLTAGSVHGRSFRVSQLPNGNVYGCATCHVSAGGGGELNLFGRDVGAITGNANVPFWSAALASLDSDGDGFTNGEELGDPEGDFDVIPGAEVTRPGDATSFPTVLPPELDPTSFESAGVGLRLNWAGGRAPFLVQRKSLVDDTGWVNWLTTQEAGAVLLRSGDSGFIRVGSQATGTVIPLTTWLLGANEVPAVDSPAQGLGFLSLEENTLTYSIPFSGLKGSAQAAHIHGPASSTQNGAVLHPLAGASGTAGALEGILTLSASQRDLILAGRTYVNLHTVDHASGEIRGQIAPVQWTAQLTGDAEVPPVPTSATGNATLELVGNQLFWTLSFSDLSGPALGAHLHGPAGTLENAPPLVTFTVPATATGSAAGTTTLLPGTVRALTDGQTYINVHTLEHGAGEIRGQVQPAF